MKAYREMHKVEISAWRKARYNKHKITEAQTHKQWIQRNPLYTTWLDMKSRCNNPKSNSYVYYGARGIKVCAAWRWFKNFSEDMGYRPEGMTLDRIDPNGDYKPSNCRWATAFEQVHNRRKAA